ncbi:hypothetical protein V2J09_006239 [Rumex salicifolius]
MAVIGLNFPSRIPRLILIPGASLFSPAKAFRNSFPLLNSSSSHFSTSQFVSPVASPGDANLVILGIETSCDDTAAAVVRGDGKILSQVVSSQADLLVQYGGVAPKMAAEAHAKVIDKVTQTALDKANLTGRDLSAVAVTIGPGLSLCLRVGVRKARQIAGEFQLPIVGVHHMEAHALVARLVVRDLQFPFIALLVSGGHNLLVLARNLGHYIQLGTTIDDAIGEAYDKTSKWLGLDMRSGGPAVEQLALEGDSKSVKFSVPMKQHKDCNFSYAGLKTQVRLAIAAKNINADIPIASASNEDKTARANIAASFQRVAVYHLEERTERAIQWALQIEPSVKSLVSYTVIPFFRAVLAAYYVLSGGVASNEYVRTRLHDVARKGGLNLVCPPPSLCTDNGKMGRFEAAPPLNEPEDALYDLRPRWPLGEEYAEGRSEARSLRKARIHPSLTSIIQASAKQ